MENFRIDTMVPVEEGQDLMSKIRTNRRNQNGFITADRILTRTATTQSLLSNTGLKIEPHLFQPMSAQEKKVIMQEKVLAATKSANQLIRERDYEDIMDQHALQIFLVRKGKIIEESPEYHSFKRLAEGRWDKVEPHIILLLKTIKTLELKLVRINGSELLSYALLHSKPTIPGVMQFLLPPDGDELTGLSFYDQLTNKAAIKIQSTIRRRIAQKFARRNRIVIRKVKYLQGWWRTVLANRAFKKNASDREMEMWARFEELQARLKTEWPDIKSGSRVEVHYTGFSGSELWKLSVEKISQRAANQIGRIFRAMHEKVEVIYISAAEIPEEVQRYYFKIMELAGLKLGPRKVHFLSLQEDELTPVPDHFSMAARILYSRRTQNKLKKVKYGLITDHKWKSCLFSARTATVR